MSDILKQMNAIFFDVFDNEDIVLTPSSSAIDIDEWDSLNHIHLATAVEKHFKIRFTSKEIQSWNNVGEMLTCIQEKGA
jgi:acyl carrier protein